MDNTLTDPQINKLVAEALGKYAELDGDCCWITAPDTPSTYGAQAMEFDPCNRPNHAWPIILENGIDIRFCCLTGGNTSAHLGSPLGSYATKDMSAHQDNNPLRAAMIVFLKMQEAI